ncbi:beta-galactosidase [Devosia subaequoris]|uniref:Beta-galactosidase n=1 Tax=Devosia subaequoris TaxID=395930 RepID=A0A7W6IR96_9HYPH|nr:glycoside hydrolase family 2 TIM barrel-domain containing protein [Devosia subaequoris]MBB4053827.1 beta-galactosidase [Devosia subaequoris]MCP1211154.1 glycoside hydrolase family 2 protein [Devosia subaequoris]
MRPLIDFNSGWLFEGTDSVRLPHTAVELPFSYFDEKAYQRVFTYEKRFAADPAWQGREVSVVFDGAMANAVVSLNGEEIAAHKDGYTPFEARLTGKLLDGENVLSVTIDGSENPEIPPFGGQIDYLTYAGLYREAWLRVTAPVFVSNAKIETPDALADSKSVRARIDLVNPQDLPLFGTLVATLLDTEGKTIATTNAAITGSTLELSFDGLSGIALWDISNPVLYTLALTLDTAAGQDQATFRFGFRTAEFTTEGFKLNGKALKLRGLNRHQSFPYVGYALGKSAQERDAEILKRELKLNMVRTSHYPQSHYFLDRCDELGLLVFEEIPGWQHIGGESWKDESVENVRRMITRDWNHPSIVIWGVRVNESHDDHDFYVRTNALARELDPTRATGGVRYITDSEMLEDVYTMNDFILGQEEWGGNRPRTPLRPQREVTGLDRVVPYMITEYGGHMYPTKSWDQEQRQAEHVLRHLEVLNAAYGDPQIAGCIGWCAFDYNTHKDFGSGDRICHHGVMDMFREPKFAAFAYTSQCDTSDEVILKPVTFWARGERNIGGVLPLIILTNCDEVELRYGNNPPKRFKPDREAFPHLPHAPVVIKREHLTDEELGLWGMSWEDATITGFIDGKPAKSVDFVSDPVAHALEVVPDTVELGAEGDTTRVMVRALDQSGRALPFFPEPVSISVSGAAERIGPGLVPLRAGSTGFWLRSTGAGPITVTVTSERLGRAEAILSAS